MTDNTIQIETIKERLHKIIDDITLKDEVEVIVGYSNNDEKTGYVTFIDFHITKE